MHWIARTASLWVLLGCAVAQDARAQTAAAPAFPTAPALICLEGVNPGFVTLTAPAPDGSPRFVRFRPGGGRILCETVGGRLVRRPLTADDHVPNAEDAALSVIRRCQTGTPVRDQSQRIVAYLGTVRC